MSKTKDGETGDDLASQVSGEELADEIGLDDDEIRHRKEFVEFDDSDVETLQGMSRIFADVRDEVAEKFYDHTSSFDETREVLHRSTRETDPLKTVHGTYLIPLGRGEYGRGYFENRARIGKLHEMVDLPVKHYIGMYMVYNDLILSEVFDRLRDEVDNVEAVDEALDRTLSYLRITNLDMQVAMDTYIQAYKDEMEGELEKRREVSERIQESVTELRDSSDEVAKSSQEITDLAREQSESMDEVSSEVSNLSATVEEIASSADEVNTKSQRAEELAEEGRDSAERTREVMRNVGEAGEEVADDVTSLRNRVEDIDEVVDVINDIADQTNLLALNASIEAARAGEAGEGFAVVADEVKSLAEESQERADEIGDLIEEIQDDTEETVESLEEANDQIDEGVEKVEESMQNLQRIAEAVRETAQGIEEVAQATDDQAASTEEVASMIDDAAEKAERVSERVDDIAAANQEQTAMVEEIDRTVDELT
ncbi:globin-coupled sensor protein [Halorutilales archaeon Cl-col2-1]